MDNYQTASEPTTNPQMNPEPTYSPAVARPRIKPQYIFSSILLLVFLAIGVLVVIQSTNKNSQDTRSKASEVSINPADYTAVLSTEEIMHGPARYPDIAYNTLKTSNASRAYMARGETYVFDVDASGKPSYKGVAMPLGAPGTVDDLGRWLFSTYKIDDNKIIGWYHSEHEKPAYTHELAYAESNDGGVTWTYPNFPDNRVITADDVYDYPNHYNTTGAYYMNHTGAGHVIVKDGYFYMFYLATGPNWHTEIARSALSDLGKPGTWKKYYCPNPADKTTCGFTEPGVGGKGTKIDGLPAGPAWVVYNTTLHRYMYPLVTGRRGFKLFFSEPDDLLTWTRSILITSPISEITDATVDNWQRYGDTSNLKYWYAYGSILSPNGVEEPVGNDFYLYYGKIYPTETHETIYLARRKISLEPNSQWNGVPAVLPLNEYKNSKGEIRATIDTPKPGTGYNFTRLLGYILPAPPVNKTSKLITDCYAGVWSDYLIINSITPHNNWTQCRVPGNKFVMNLGYTYNEQAPGTVPLYRCFNNQRLDHYASVGSSCEEPNQYGYLFPPKVNSVPTPTSIPTSAPIPTPTVSPAPTPIPTIVPDSAADQNAHFVSYGNVPTTLRVGEKVNVTITMQNTGNIVWTNENGYLLGDNENNGIPWGVARVRLPSGTTVAPTQSVTFPITITAPSTPGTYRFEWQMLQQKVRWFGEISTLKMIMVTQ